jgi:hypothetical protein
MRRSWDRPGRWTSSKKDSKTTAFGSISRQTAGFAYGVYTRLATALSRHIAIRLLAALGPGEAPRRSAGTNFLLHRISFLAHHGRDIQPGMVGSHLCGQKSCFNWDHIVEETQGRNLARDRLRCPGPIYCSRHPTHLIINLCTHHPQCLRPPRTDVLCCASLLGLDEQQSLGPGQGNSETDNSESPSEAVREWRPTRRFIPIAERQRLSAADDHLSPDTESSREQALSQDPSELSGAEFLQLASQVESQASESDSDDSDVSRVPSSSPLLYRNR